MIATWNRHKRGSRQHNPHMHFPHGLTIAEVIARIEQCLSEECTESGKAQLTEALKYWEAELAKGRL